MSGFSKGVIDQVLAAVRPVHQPEVPEASRITVHAAVSRFSVLYEKIRNVIDYNDEHLLRKAAIKRIFSRQLVLESEAEVIARNLVRELIAAKYLPNGVLPEQLIIDVSVPVAKYLAIDRTQFASSVLTDWLRGVVSVEIEEMLVDMTTQKALVTFLYERLADRVNLRGATLSEADVRLQVYVAVHRSLLKSDDEVLSYKLLRAYVPEWLRPEEWLGDARVITEKLPATQIRIAQTLAHPLSQKFLRLVKPWAVSLRILWDACMEKPDQVEKLFVSPETLHLSVGRLADRRYKAAKTKLRRGAVRATFYLLVTKMLIAFAVEVPVELLWYGKIAMTALIINVSFPPLLMFFVGLLIRVVGKENTTKIQSTIDKLLNAEPLPLQEIKVRAEHGTVGATMMRLSYGALFFLIFGGIGWFLVKLDFTPVSAAIFLFFLCVVSFFAFRLRQNAREFIIVDSKETVGSFLMDFISLPILRSGLLLSRGISRLNVFLFFFDFLFEAPFKILLSVLEEWLLFLKDKKDELH